VRVFVCVVMDACVCVCVFVWDDVVMCYVVSVMWCVCACYCRLLTVCRGPATYACIYPTTFNIHKPHTH